MLVCDVRIKKHSLDGAACCGDWDWAVGGVPLHCFRVSALTWPIHLFAVAVVHSFHHSMLHDVCLSAVHNRTQSPRVCLACQRRLPCCTQRSRQSRRTSVTRGGGGWWESSVWRWSNGRTQAPDCATRRDLLRASLRQPGKYRARVLFAAGGPSSQRDVNAMLSVPPAVTHHSEPTDTVLPSTAICETRRRRMSSVSRCSPDPAAAAAACLQRQRAHFDVEDNGVMMRWAALWLVTVWPL